jgi:hypothetical protein
MSSLENSWLFECFIFETAEDFSIFGSQGLRVNIISVHISVTFKANLIRLLKNVSSDEILRRARTDNEDPEGEYRYRSTLSLTSVLDWGGWLTPLPGGFTPGRKTHCIGGWVGPRAGLDGCGISRPHRD